MREKPKVILNRSQEEALLFPEFRGQGAFIVLDNEQSMSVTYHMIQQLCLDNISKKELVSNIAPMIGIVPLTAMLCIAHEKIAESLILPYVNEKQYDDPPYTYASTVFGTMFKGTGNEIIFVYQLPSTTICEDFCYMYRRSRQYLYGISNELAQLGLKIYRVESNNLFLHIEVETVA